MGSQVSYPLTYDKIEKLENKFSIFNEEEFIGMIQEVRIEEDNIHIGRFVLNPQKTGIGFGTEALKKFIDFIFKDENIRSEINIRKNKTVNLYYFNQNAKHIYDKLGFKVDEVVETPKRKYIMRKYR